MYGLCQGTACLPQAGFSRAELTSKIKTALATEGCAFDIQAPLQNFQRPNMPFA
jgi:hypothetical protein